MPSIRSDSRWVGERETWSLALLVTATLFLTLQALGVALSGRLLMVLLTVLVVSVLVLRWVDGWRGNVYLKPLLIMLLTGQLGMLFGAAMDFGAAGLVMLAGWCSAVDGAGLGGLWGKLGIAPWSYAWMLIGCNLGMLLGACHAGAPVRQGMSRWLFLALSNLGMLLGLLLLEAWQPAVSGSLQSLAVLMVVQTLLAMAAGMAAVWWLSARLGRPGLAGLRSLPATGK